MSVCLFAYMVVGSMFRLLFSSGLFQVFILFDFIPTSTISDFCLAYDVSNESWCNHQYPPDCWWYISAKSILSLIEGA